MIAEAIHEAREARETRARLEAAQRAEAVYLGADCLLAGAECLIEAGFIERVGGVLTAAAAVLVQARHLAATGNPSQGDPHKLIRTLRERHLITREQVGRLNHMLAVVSAVSHAKAPRILLLVRGALDEVSGDVEARPWDEARRVYLGYTPGRPSAVAEGSCRRRV